MTAKENAFGQPLHDGEFTTEELWKLMQLLADVTPHGDLGEQAMGKHVIARVKQLWYVADTSQERWNNYRRRCRDNGEPQPSWVQWNEAGMPE